MTAAIAIVNGPSWLDAQAEQAGSEEERILEEMLDALSQPGTQALVLMPESDSLCLGWDLKAVASCETRADVQALRARRQRLHHQLGLHAKPTVAVLGSRTDPAAFGAALSCRYIVAADTDHPGLEISAAALGMIPPPAVVSRFLGRLGRVGLRTLAQRTKLSPREAKALGLVDGLAPLARTMDLAMALALRPPRPAKASSLMASLNSRILRAPPRRPQDLVALALHEVASARNPDIIAAYWHDVLALSAPVKRQIQTRLASRGLADPRIHDTLQEARSAAQDERKRLAMEGLPHDHVVDALSEWGLGAPLVAVGKRPFANRIRGARPTPEEIQLRVALRLWMPAERAVQLGIDAQTVDRAFVEELGFPAFRGGPLAHARELGPETLRARLHHCQLHWGDRFRWPNEGRPSEGRPNEAT